MPEILVAADVGASKTLVALACREVAGWAWLTSPQRFATPRDPAEVSELIFRAVGNLVAGRGSVAAAAVAIPGPVARDRGVVSHLPNLGWHEVPFAAMLAERLGVPVVLDDDARLGALGEWVAGAGQGTGSLAYVTVSSGIGCGLVLAGEPWAGSHGLAGEFGHIVVDRAGPRCGCGHRGCVEAYAGGLAMARAARRAWPRARLRDGTRSPRSAADVFRLARRGDATASVILSDAASALAFGLAAIAAVFDPDLIAVGGSVALSQRRWIGAVAARSRRDCIAQTGAAMRVVTAGLGDNSALTGAAQIAARLAASETAQADDKRPAASRGVATAG